MPQPLRELQWFLEFRCMVQYFIDLFYLFAAFISCISLLAPKEQLVSCQHEDWYSSWCNQGSYNTLEDPKDFTLEFIPFSMLHNTDMQLLLNGAPELLAKFNNLPNHSRRSIYWKCSLHASSAVLCAILMGDFNVWPRIIGETGSLTILLCDISATDVNHAPLNLHLVSSFCNCNDRLTHCIWMHQNHKKALSVKDSTPFNARVKWPVPYQIFCNLLLGQNFWYWKAPATTDINETYIEIYGTRTPVSVP